jgi:hypothetical protein
MSFLTDLVKGISQGPNIHDWRHANNIFVGNNYALAPKQGFLFHTAFDIDTSVARIKNQEILELGLLVKSVQIPKYTIDVKTFNAYNRPNIIQQKIKYDPITITFHDDSSDVVRDFWYDYMSHFYRDTDYNPTVYLAAHKYASMTPPKQNSANSGASSANFWGYQPAKYSKNGSPERYLNSIKIYSLHRKRFTEYILINPVITGFQHGQHTQGTSDFVENTMTVAYETVLYNYGSVSTKKGAQEPAGFATLNYDKTPSPLTPQGGGTNSLFGPGGAASAVTGVSDALDDDNYLGAGLIAARAVNNVKGQNVIGMAKTELTQIGMGVVTGDTNTLNRLGLPMPGQNSGMMTPQTGAGTLSQPASVQE